MSETVDSNCLVSPLSLLIVMLILLPLMSSSVQIGLFLAFEKIQKKFFDSSKNRKNCTSKSPRVLNSCPNGLFSQFWTVLPYTHFIGSIGLPAVPSRRRGAIHLRLGKDQWNLHLNHLIDLDCHILVDLVSIRYQDSLRKERC